jgi:hypothetical protein
MGLRWRESPPIPVTRALAPESQVWAPVCFRMDMGMGLGPWALALGGAWALALGASLALALAWVFFSEGCWERVPPGSRYLPKRS